MLCEHCWYSTTFINGHYCTCSHISYTPLQCIQYKFNIITYIVQAYVRMYTCLNAESNTTTMAPSHTPPQPRTSDTPVLGLMVALAVLLASVVGACVVAVIACICLRSRRSRKQSTFRYSTESVLLSACSAGCSVLDGQV